MRIGMLPLSCVVSGMAAAQVVHAQPSAHVVVAARDRYLDAALAHAFTPSGMTVIPVEDAPPASIAELAAASRALAEREHASSVVWLIEDPGGATLVTYDWNVDRVLVRTLPYRPPLTPARAAEIARMVRTMLRALKIPDEPDAAPAIQSITREAATPGSPALPARTRLALVGGLGIRLGQLGDDGQIEGTVGVIWRPDRVGVLATAALTPRSELQSMSFRGRSSDQSLAVAARVPLAVTRALDVAIHGGVALHVVHVEGSAGVPVSRRRFDPALRIGATPSVRPARGLDVGVEVSTDTLLRRQRYETQDRGVLVMPRVQFAASLIIAWRFL